MPQVSQYKEAPYQGVSQAPAQVRLPTQAEAIENAIVAVPEGFQPRPPFVYLDTVLSSGARTDCLFEGIPERKDTPEVFLLINTEGSDRIARVFNAATLAAETLNVTAAAQTYLNAGSPVPATDIRTLTVADFTFILNRKQTIAKEAATVAGRPFEALIWVRQSAYGRTYKVTVTPTSGTPVTVSYLTPTGATAASTAFIDTDVIAKILVDGVGAPPDGGVISATALDDLVAQGFTVTSFGAVVYLSHPSIDFTVDVEDGQSGLALLAVKDKVQRFSDLPAKAVDGFIVRIGQESADEADDFFVVFNVTAGSGTGVWEETIAPGAEVGLDPETMPLALTYDGADWDLDVQPWSQRLVGDEDLSPDPGYVGGVIEDMSFWRSRLAFIYDEGVQLAASDDPFRVYPSTLSAVLDSDPVELVSPFPGSSALRYGTPFDNRLVLSGENVHLYVQADGLVTPQTTSIDILFKSAFKREIRPLPSKTRLYYAALKGKNYSSVNEVFIDKTTDTTEPEEMTRVVPRYLPADIDRAANCDVQFMSIFGSSASTELTLHIYRYSRETTERLQNAWSKWALPFPLAGMFFRDTRLTAVVKDGALLHVVEADCTPGLLDPHVDATMLTHWDMRCDESQLSFNFDAIAGTTAITLPFTPSADTSASVAAPGGQGGPLFGMDDEPLDAFQGQIIDVVSFDAPTKTLVVNGDWSDCPLFVGQKYASRWRPSKIFPPGPDGQPIRSGRTTVQRLLFDLANTGYLRFEIRAADRPVSTMEFQGYIWDSPESDPTKPPDSSIPFGVPVHCHNEFLTIDVINDSHFGCKALGFEWLGKVNPKAQRIGGS